MTQPNTQNQTDGGEGGRTEEPKATRFQLYKDGPYVTADDKLASHLQGNGDSPVVERERELRKGGAETVATVETTVTRDRTPSVKRGRTASE